jgi:hypothetical protein
MQNMQSWQLELLKAWVAGVAVDLAGNIFVADLTHCSAMVARHSLNGAHHASG